MAAIAHVFLAQRVRSIHKEKDTSFLEKNYPQNCYGHRQTQKDIFACCVYPGEDGSQGAQSEDEQQNFSYCESHVVRHQSAHTIVQMW